MIFEFELDLPPSSNHRLAPIITRTGPGMVKTPAYRSWMIRAVQLLTEDRPRGWQPFDEPMVMCVTIHFPDRRKRDIDNVLKPLNDVITQAKIWQDDSLVTLLIARRGAIAKPGRICTALVPLKDFPHKDLLPEFGG